ncbi:2-C-methyl-D-erythritol 4-phosphate cytidylyltransferase [uncultured Microscilla sp.]|uniref:2-C-methyl-D-erythritol 4-phosphate cytidylyltransferase n=1 Tax=uncultured Microscilla sp. TaxID=432653 RepID=UPI00261DC3F6|nr:2-C-methyl-D-erythritol 4-phosphate cytidylyltransferase [uncultured Microscilla sp.]
MAKYALIVAGGSGTRMNNDTPKQFLEILGKPILMHTISRFYLFSPLIKIVLVLPKDEIDYWKHLVSQHSFDYDYKIVAGGKTRFQSVKKGLAAIEADADDVAPGMQSTVAIHDGVRPLVAVKTIALSHVEASNNGCAIASVDLKDSIREVQPDGGTKAINRDNFRLMQTPQAFRVNAIKAAYEIEETPELTDDASVFEKAGHAVHLINGSYQNIKITTPEDLAIAKAILDESRK